MTGSQIADTLSIDEYTINILVRNNRIPYENTNGIPRFNPHIITGWLKQGHILTITEEKAYIEELKKFYAAQFPEAIQALQELDRCYAAKRPGKGYSLSKVPSKRYGFLYYVRYIEHGKLIPSRWNTRTNDLASAEQFARDNRERILAEYHSRREGESRLYGILSEYYKAGSEYMITSAQRGRTLADKTRYRYHAFVVSTLIPYLKKHDIRTFSDITQPEVTKLQDYLLQNGNKPQTVNKLISCTRLIFDYLVTHGTIPSNPFRGVVPIKPKKKDRAVRGCYELDSIKGVFDKKWTSSLHFLLCLVIYTTDMRNSEIDRIQVKDIIDIGKYRFIDIPESKTENGVRIIPLHPFVYEKLMRYIKESKKQKEDYLFEIGQSVYQSANREMGKMLKKTPDELKKLNITYYSGRAFWKTMMNVEELGDVEEYFMGHKVSSDVAKLYNHKDKVGKKNMLAKTKEVFRVLDKYLFTSSARTKVSPRPRPSSGKSRNTPGP